MAAAVQRSNPLESLLYRRFIPHLSDPRMRYTTFALSILSAGGLALKFGKATLLLTVIPATLLILYQKNQDLKTLQPDPAQRAEKAARLAYHCLVVSGFWGIVLSGAALALTFESGKLLLHGGRSLNLLSIAKAINSLAAVGWLWVPLSWYFLSKSNDVLFNKAENRLAIALAQFLTVVQQEAGNFAEINALIAQMSQNPGEPPDINPNLKPLFPLFNFLCSFDYKSIIPPYLHDLSAALENQMRGILSLPFPHSLGRAQEEIGPLQEKVIAVARLVYAPPPQQEAVSALLANRVFHYVLTGALALIPLYANPIPTAVGLGLGWFYPLVWGSEERLRQWNTAPNFLEKSPLQKCYFIWRQTFFALNQISSSPLIGYPSAMVHGFFWSEILYHYAAPQIARLT
jgi:hypothetical protein